MSVSEEKYKTATTFMLPFEKMHGLGNDFVMVNVNHLPDNPSVPQEERTFELELTKRICDRNLGIGADGLIVIDTVKESEEAIRSWRYYNSDGSVGEMCGNGIRCAAKYIYEHGLSNEETSFKIETLAGDISIELKEDELVKVGMGAPREISTDSSLRVLNQDGSEYQFNYDFVSMGNPHAIAFFNDASAAELRAIANHGAAIEVHEDFPNRTNVEFARILDEKTIELIVWERGCGFTQACGTGACATVVAAIKRGLMQQDQDVEVILPGGSLIIRWDSVTDEIYMTGPAVMSFVGYYNDERVKG